MSSTVFSVSYLSRILEEVIRGSLFHNIYLRGEIQSKNIKGKYTYLTLIDSEDNGAISASITVLLSPYTKVESPEFNVGDTVLLKGSLSYYKQRATVSFWADYLIIDGEGRELLRLKKLREKLDREGLFLPEHKRELPLYPRGVGVVTSESGAAINDVKATLKKRFPVRVKVFAATVQGNEAAKSLYSAIDRAIQDDEIDIILLTRGGGSKQDLAPFNDEKVVRLLHSSPHPVISAVGHQIDTSLTDLVADKTAITPTDAANLIGYSLEELSQRRERQDAELKNRLKSTLGNKLYEYQNYVLRLNSLSPLKNLENLRTRIRVYREELRKPLLNNRQIKTYQWQSQHDVLKSLFENSLKEKYNNIERMKTLLEGLSPRKILDRGYAYVTKGQNMISSVQRVTSGDDVSVHLKDGDFTAKVR